MNTLITTDSILLDLDATSKVDLIHRICGQLFMLRKTEDPAALFNDIMEREQIVSTFAGSLIAIPHVISQHISAPVLCFVRVSGDQFTWSHVDEEVRFVLLLAAPAQEDLKQLRQSQSYVFSSIAQLIGRADIIELWSSTDDKAEILDSLNQAFNSNLNTITTKPGA